MPAELLLMAGPELLSAFEMDILGQWNDSGILEWGVLLPFFFLLLLSFPFLFSSFKEKAMKSRHFSSPPAQLPPPFFSPHSFFPSTCLLQNHPAHL